MIENKKLCMSVEPEGYISGLFIKDDQYNMNWVIEPEYLKQAKYEAEDKLFGQFDIIANGKKFQSSNVKPVINESEEKAVIEYPFDDITVNMTYDLSKKEDELHWVIQLKNTTEKNLEIKEFGVWIAFAYVMFRDKNVLRNIHNSAAVFPSVSTNYTKLNAVRRDGENENLGMYQVEGKAISIGTYCDYENLFFENVSPSLDGMLFHKLYFAGGYPEGFENHDWIYEKSGFSLEPGENKVWEYVMNTNKNQTEFYEKGFELNHPKITYTPLNIIGENVRASIEVPHDLELVSTKAIFKQNDRISSIDVLVDDGQKEGWKNITFKPVTEGEHKVVFNFSNGTQDFVVLNVMDKIDQVVEERVAYICNELYTGEKGNPPYAFQPISNQGESLGKANLVLKKNLMGRLDVEQVRKVEKCAVNYVRPKWFEDGDFHKPVKLYGDFYRCMDFEYIGHLFYFLSEFDDEVLELHSADTYLEWAASVFELRVNPDLHYSQRGKEESQMLGVYFLYIKDLLSKLRAKNMTQEYLKISLLWEKIIERIDAESDTYKAAITEHYYDNAGFGPTAGALAESSREGNTKKYGKLLLANIGYSNDFRAQNPDRWWEALTYMIHSLWGGVTAAATFKVFEGLKDKEYLEASYRATAGVLYCYDTNSTTTTKLEKGMAASTYAVAGPHINRPDLSRNRFGQATFYKDGGIFARLFENDSQTPDWDMGEEMVAYLENFGDKTFIVKERDSIHVINGSFEELADGYKITSFAPYSKKFYLVSDNDIILLEEKENQQSIIIKK